MILRSALSRSVAVSVLLSAGLVLAPCVPTLAQSLETAHEQTPYPGTPVEQIIARVNDRVIDTSEYQHAMQQLDQEAQQGQWTEQQSYDHKANLLRDLIDQQLLLSRGKQLGITGETQLVLQLDAMRKQYHLATMADLQKAAEAQGVSWADFKANLRNHIIEQKVIGQEVGQHINISPMEVQSYYNEHKQDFKQSEEVRLSEILIPTANPDDATQVAAAKTQADKVYAQLKAGADFAALAKKDSSGVTAASGGDLGEFKRGQLAKVLEDDTFSLKPGQFTEPVLTKQGYIILKVTKHTNAGVAPLSAVETQIENIIGEQKMQPAMRAYLTQLRENAYIDIMDGYTDTGASPNEMKPIYSAYVSPTARKKERQKAERTRFRPRGRHATRREAKNRKPLTKKQLAKMQKQSLKPGGKVKVRFGRAPQEVLPPPVDQPQQASGTTSNGTVALAPGEEAAPQQAEAKPRKVRFATYERRRDKKKHEKSEKGKKAAQSNQFAVPPPTTLEKATREQQDQALGLNGDTSKIKKVNPNKEGPKRRFRDEKKEKPTEAPAATAPADSGQQ